MAETRPANDDELEAIRETLLHEEIPERKRYNVLSVEGTHFDDDGVNKGTLHGAVFFRPLLIHGRLCLMESYHRKGTKTDSGYEWDKSTDANYLYWEVDRDCEIEDRSKVPSEAVIAFYPIHSADMVRIIRDAEKLLQEGIRYALDEIKFASTNWPIGTPELSEINRTREMYEGFKDDRSLRLFQVDLNKNPLPGSGFRYTASYVSDRTDDLPVIPFSITEDGFVVHGRGQGHRGK
jgi:hypothetical protein